VWGLTCQESNEWTGCQHVDREAFRMEIDFPTKEEQILRGRVCATRRKDTNANLLRRTHDLLGIDSRTAGSAASVIQREFSPSFLCLRD
jgi:hypothetical protein